MPILLARTTLKPQRYIVWMKDGASRIIEADRIAVDYNIEYELNGKHKWIASGEWIGVDEV